MTDTTTSAASTETADHTSGDDASESSGRQRNPRGKGDQLRVDLLNAAAALLAEHGSPEKVGVRAVAAEVGVSPTAVYRHFSSGDELIAAAVDHAWEDFSGLMASSMTAADPFERFTAMGHAYVNFAVNDPGRYQALFSKQKAFKAGELPMARQAFEMLVAVVTELLNTNDDPRDPFFVATQVHTWIHGMVMLCGGDEDSHWPAATELLETMPEALDLFPKQ